MESQVNGLLPLATKIAREFSNIPGLPHAEIEIAAQEALARAATAFDASKGEFTAYAARAMRNQCPTRARAGLIVVGDKQAARNSGVSHLASFVAYVERLSVPRTPETLR